MPTTGAIRSYGFGTYGYGTYGGHPASAVIDAPTITVSKVDATTGAVLTDLSCDIRGLSIRTGRSQALDAFAAGTCVLELANATDKYSAWTPNSVWSAGASVGDGITLGPYRTSAPITVSVTRQGQTFPLFTGTTDSVEDTWPGIIDAVAVVQCTDAFKVFARYENSVPAPGTGNGESTGNRILRFLNTMGYPTAKTRLSTGTQNLAGTDMVGTMLNLMDEVRECEWGYLFIDGGGWLNFYDRNAPVTNTRMATVQWTLSDQAGLGGAYSDLHLVADDDLVYNTATITRTGSAFPQTTSYAPSVAWFGLRSYPGGNDLPFVTDVQASNLADLIVSQFNDNDRRVESVTFHANAQNPYLLDMACGVQLLDRIRVVRTFPGGHQLDFTLLVQGIEHNIRANVDGDGIGEWTVTLSTSNVVDYALAARWDDLPGWDDSLWGQ